jgi:hypothetical protein
MDERFWFKTDSSITGRVVFLPEGSPINPVAPTLNQNFIKTSCVKN